MKHYMTDICYKTLSKEMFLNAEQKKCYKNLDESADKFAKMTGLEVDLQCGDLLERFLKYTFSAGLISGIVIYPVASYLYHKCKKNKQEKN